MHGQRLVSSWLYLNPAWQDDPAVRAYLDSLGFTRAWRSDLCQRPLGYVEPFNVHPVCETASSRPEHEPDDAGGSGSQLDGSLVAAMDVKRQKL